MKTRFLFVVSLLIALGCSGEPLPRRHVFFHTDFDGKKLTVEKPSIVPINLPVEQMRGYTIRGTALVQAENVTTKPNSWNGIKFMLVIETPSNKLWPQAEIGTGSFDWKRCGFTARIPVDATAVTLCLGLEQVTGKVSFDQVCISVAKAPVPAVAPVVGSGAPFKGHDLTRLRGVMISPNITADSLRTLGRDWRANLIRWQLIRHETTTDYDQWIESELRKLDAALPVCEEVGLRVVVDLHSPPGGKKTVSGYVGSDDRLFTDKSCQEKFVAVWQRIATRYKDVKAIWGYDLVNEPVEDLVEEGCDDWQELAGRTARAIRAIDAGRAIIVEPSPWGSPKGLSDFVPIAVSNVIYSVHMYEPSAFTHQGVHKRGREYRYPGEIDGKLWDKAQLEKALQPVVAFQKKYNAHIYIGEFSAIRWAPDNSACRYLKDVIDIFESHGWDWSYHAFREWNGWSVEHGPDRQDNKPTAAPTDRQRLLCEWFSQNQKPR